MVKKAAAANQVNWNQVYYFFLVASHGSLKEAAASLGVSPSTLSEHVTQLEKSLNVQLFHRHHRKLELTSEGSRIFQYAKRMFETGLRLIDVVSPIPLGEYPVAVGLVPSASLPIAYEVLRSFIRERARSNVRFQHASQEELERGLAESRFDFGFSDRAPERKDIQWRPVCASILNFYARADLAARKLPELLEELPLLICGRESTLRDLIERYLLEHDIHPRSIVTSDYPGMVLDLCSSGDGVAVLGEEAFRLADLPSVRAVKGVKEMPRIRDRLFALWPVGAEKSAPVERLLRLLSSQGQAG